MLLDLFWLYEREKKKISLLVTERRGKPRSLISRLTERELKLAFSEDIQANERDSGKNVLSLVSGRRGDQTQEAV